MACGMWSAPGPASAGSAAGIRRRSWGTVLRALVGIALFLAARE